MRILITGAAGGIARKVIEKIKNKKDVHIFVSVHTEKQLELALKRYKENTNMECFKLDITNKDDREAASKMDIDVIVCNAAIGEGGSIAEIEMDRVRDTFEVNVFSNFELMQLLLKNMLGKGKGKIIMMSSLAGIVPIPFLGSYCSTKSSIRMLTKTLRMELSYLHKDIDIICIEPGLYCTGFNRVMLDNKYSWMEEKSYFKEELSLIRKRENILLTLLEKKNLESIVCKIEKAIFSKNSKKTYKAPKLQSFFAKIYILLSK